MWESKSARLAVAVVGVVNGTTGILELQETFENILAQSLRITNEETEAPRD